MDGTEQTAHRGATAGTVRHAITWMARVHALLDGLVLTVRRDALLDIMECFVLPSVSVISMEPRALHYVIQ